MNDLVSTDSGRSVPVRVFCRLISAEKYREAALYARELAAECQELARTVDGPEWVGYGRASQVWGYLAGEAMAQAISA